MWISIHDNMTDVDNSFFGDLNSVDKFDHHKYGELFHKFFTHTINETSEGFKVTWTAITNKNHIQGWILLCPIKKVWKRKPIMGSGGFQIVDSGLNPIHEFMEKYIIYGEESPLVIRKFFIDLSMELLRKHFNPLSKEGE